MPIEILISLRKFVRFQYTIVTTLLLLSLLYYISREMVGGTPFRIFDVGAEPSIPTWFSAANLMLSSILLFVMYVYTRQTRGEGKFYWLGLSVLFLGLSIDEIAMIH